jgi:hypothetical protein
VTRSATLFFLKQDAQVAKVSPFLLEWEMEFQFQTAIQQVWASQMLSCVSICFWASRSAKGSAKLSFVLARSLAMESASLSSSGVCD